MKYQNLQARTKQFALQVIKFCEGLPKDETSKILTRQLLQSGTSVGANYRAACLAKSKPTFISKLGDVLEEADESGYCVELLVDAGKAQERVAGPILKRPENWWLLLCRRSIQPSGTPSRNNNSSTVEN